MALKTTAQEVTERWGIDVNPGDQAEDVILQILTVIDDRLKKLESGLWQDPMAGPTEGKDNG